MKMELRVQDAELRANTDGTMTVSGYVNKTGQLSNVLGVTKRFVEKIAKEHSLVLFKQHRKILIFLLSIRANYFWPPLVITL